MVVTGSSTDQHRWDAETAMRLIERERCTHTGGVPTVAWQLIEHPARGKYDLSSLQAVAYGGAMFRSVDSGANWTSVSGGLPNVMAADLLYHAKDRKLIEDVATDQLAFMLHLKPPARDSGRAAATAPAFVSCDGGSVHSARTGSTSGKID